MGQTEILLFLKLEYEKNKNKWFSPQEIIEGLKTTGITESGFNRIHICLMQLAGFKLIRFRGIGMWEHKKVFQYKP